MVGAEGSAAAAPGPPQGPGQTGRPAERPPAEGGRGGRPDLPVRGEGGQAEGPRLRVGLLLLGRPGRPQLREAGRGLEEAAADPTHALPAGDRGEGGLGSRVAALLGRDRAALALLLGTAVHRLCPCQLIWAGFFSRL